MTDADTIDAPADEAVSAADPAPGARGVEQISLEDWPEGSTTPDLTLNVSPERLAEVLGVTFEDAADSLDDFKAAVVRLPRVPHGARAVFQSYADSPSGGTHVIFERRGLIALRALVDVLRLSPDDVQWASIPARTMLSKIWKKLNRGQTRSESHGYVRVSKHGLRRLRG